MAQELTSAKLLLDVDILEERVARAAENDYLTATFNEHLLDHLELLIKAVLWHGREREK